MDIAQFIGSIEHSRIRWNRDQIKRARGYLVYIVWGVDGVPIYIGRSTVGLHRPLNPGHRCAIDFNAAEYVEFICVPDLKECFALERRLIYHLKPRKNKFIDRNADKIDTLAHREAEREQEKRASGRKGRRPNLRKLKQAREAMNATIMHESFYRK